MTERGLDRKYDVNLEHSVPFHAGYMDGLADALLDHEVAGCDETRARGRVSMTEQS
jgi:hypothetical protein